MYNYEGQSKHTHTHKQIEKLIENKEERQKKILYDVHYNWHNFRYS